VKTDPRITVISKYFQRATTLKKPIHMRMSHNTMMYHMNKFDVCLPYRDDSG